jgi:hypothetical protein
MSNVIIGIIGVILFIGLAIAGTSILGSDFMTASASAQAATVTSHLNQIAQGVQTLQARRGVTLPANTGAGIGAALVSYKALDEVPINPLTPGNPYIATDAQGSATAGQTRIIATILGSSKLAHDTCFAIEEQAGNPNPAAVVDASTRFDTQALASPRVGCIMNFYQGNQYTAYIPV